MMINNNDHKTMCADYTCRHCRHDRCFAPTLNGTKPYQFVGKYNSDEECEQYLTIGNPFFKGFKGVN